MSRTDIQLVAVQMRLKLTDFWTAQAFEAKIRQILDKVGAQIDVKLPTLVVFPEDVGLMLAVQGMQRTLENSKTISEAIARSIRANFAPVLWNKVTKNLAWVPGLFYHRNHVIAKTYFDVFSRLARAYRVHVVAGSTILPPYECKDGVVDWKMGPTKPEVFNTSYLFDPSGRVVGGQAKTCLISLESDEALHLSSAPVTELEVYETDLGRVGIAICLDAFQDDVAQTLQNKGAQILVQPSANPAPWSKEQQEDWLHSSFRRTVLEQRFAYAVNPMMNGNLWDINFYGQSSIVACDTNLQSTELGYRNLQPSPGFVAVAESDNCEEILVARVPRP